MNPLGKALGVAVRDVDGDGRIDLVVANDTSPNNLCRNEKTANGIPVFRDVAVEAGVAVGEDGRARGAMGVAFGDTKNDGGTSLVIGNFSNEMWSVWSAGPKGDFFVDESVQSGIGRTSLLPLTFGVAFADFDLDGVLDLVGVNGHVEPSVQDVQPTVTYRQPPLLYRGLGAGRFADVSSQAGASFLVPIVGRGLAVADLDGDGRPDLVVTENGGPARIFRNVTETPARVRATPARDENEESRRPRSARRLDGERPQARRRGLGRRRLSLGERQHRRDRPRLGGYGRRGRRPLAGRHDGFGERPRSRPLPLGRRRGPGGGETLAQSHLLEVQLVLDPVQHVVADDFLPPEAQELFALDVERLAAQRLRGAHRGEPGRRRLRFEALQRPDPLDVLLPHGMNLVGVNRARVQLSVEMSDRGLGEREPGVTLFALGGPVLRHAEPADEGRQREALDHERAQDDRKREEDQKVARRKRASVRQSERQRERGRERDDAAHPRPAHDRHGLPGRVRMRLPEARQEVSRQIRARIYPHEADDHHGAERREHAVHDGGPGRSRPLRIIGS